MDTMTSNQYVAGQKRIYGVIKQWNKTADGYAEMGVDVLKLLANPDTELSQAMQAWELYRSATKRIDAMRDELATRYPDYDFYI